MNDIANSKLVISGHIRKRYSTLALEGARVDVQTTKDWKEGIYVATYNVDEGGDFQTDVMDIPAYPGITGYRLIVSCEGYRTAEYGFEVIGGRAGTKKNFQLSSDIALTKGDESVPNGTEVSGEVRCLGKGINKATIWFTQVIVSHGWARETGLVFKAETNKFGDYEIPLLPPGKYRYYAEAKGYKTSGKTIHKVLDMGADKSWVGTRIDFDMEK